MNKMEGSKKRETLRENKNKKTGQVMNVKKKYVDLFFMTKSSHHNRINNDSNQYDNHTQP